MTKRVPLNFLHLLDTKQRRSFLILVSQMICIAFLEFTGIALVLPFIRFVGGDLDIKQLPSFLSNSLNGIDENQLMINGGVLIFCLIVLSTIMKIYLSWREQKFVWDISHSLGIQQLKNMLTKPYSFFINKNSSEIITTLIVETSTTVRGVLLPYAQIISNSIVALLFLSMITLLHPKISMIMVGTGFIVGLIMVLLLKRKLQIIGNKRLQLERSRFLQLKESIIGIKTVKTSQKEQFFLHKFEDVSHKYSQIKPFVNTLNAVPKNALDIILFGGVILVLTGLILKGNEVTAVLPTLTFYVLVGFKLMPTFQNIINAIITIRFSWPSFQAVFDSVEQDSQLNLNHKVVDLSFENQLELSNCSFAHNPDQYILQDISLNIVKGQKIGIVGYSGSGKTTLVEIISGLLIPDSGSIILDQTEINQTNVSGLMKLIAFIPQDVFFFDDTILKNITLEEDVDNIDMSNLSTLLSLLNLDTLIEELPSGLQTRVGEHGIKISGGQKQRIGFARALYKNPKILVLDESTSALDYVTESELLIKLRQNFPELTIIKVAHRLKSVEDCNVIYFIDKGKIIAHGTFTEVIHNNALFKEMVKAGTI